MQTDEIIAKTKDIWCYGLWDDGLVRRIEFARTLHPGEKVVEFGIGGGRNCYIIGMANPDVYIFTFDFGRRDIDDEELLVRTIDRAHSFGVTKIMPMIEEATLAIPRWKSPIGMLGIDTDGEGTGEQLKRWAPFVRTGGRIFVQNYGLEKYSKIKVETDAFIKSNGRYVLGVRTPSGDHTNCSVQEIEVL